MQSPSLAELPIPSRGQTGWPWTEESERLPDTMPDGSPWPKISIVTPSYGQGQFIEETIRAVLLQGYPDIEFIIIDGGSKDNTVEIIKKYQLYLAYWVSEKDNGQANAINKGFARATGQIYYWINSDDWPEKNTFRLVAQEFQRLPQVDVLFGNCYFIDENYKVLKLRKGYDFNTADLIDLNPIEQNTVFFRSKVWLTYGQIKESLHFIVDFELWLRWSLKGIEFKYCPGIYAYFRLHKTSKSTQLQITNITESINLLLDLKNKGEIPAAFYPNIGNCLYRLCFASYWLHEPRLFRSVFFKYLKYTRRLPDYKLLIRALLALGGKPAMKLASSLKRTTPGEGLSS
jgi:glycosyltransferase involved in cell wall biosynthesis